MKKTFIIIALFSIMVSAASCTLFDTEIYDKSSELGCFADNYVNDAVISPVLALLECETKSGNILTPGFEAIQNGIHLRLVSAADSIWTASNNLESDKLTFSTEIKMLPDYIQGLHQWKCSTSGTYNESKTYFASFTTSSPAMMKWGEKKSSTSFSRTLAMTGKFLCIPTLQSTGEQLDRCTISYDNVALDSNDRDYKVSLSN